MDVRVRASIGHGEEEGPVVLQLEVLVGKLLAVNGLASSALLSISGCPCMIVRDGCD